MFYSLKSEYNLRGYAFEYISRIILRRIRQNNFIFQVNRFDSIDEILQKYNFKDNGLFSKFISYLRIEWGRCDLIEFEVNNIQDRILQNIVIYDVKTKLNSVLRSNFEFCLSNYKFFEFCKCIGIKVLIVNVVLLNDWSFSFELINYDYIKKRVYSRFKN